MKRAFILFFLAAFASTSFALTDQERKIVMDAKQHWQSAMREREQMKADIVAAQSAATSAAQSASLAQASAQSAETKAQDAQKQVDVEHKNLVAAESLVKKMQKVYDQCTSHWGLGAIAYGVGELAKHIFIAIIVIAVLGIGIFVLSFFFPLIGVIFGVVARAIGAGLRALGRILKNMLPAHAPPLTPPPASTPPPPTA